MNRSSDAAVARLREWVVRLWGTLRGRRLDDDIQQELAAHIELAAEALRRQGHDPDEAARLARVRFGNATLAAESMREQRGFLSLSTVWLDIKLGLRMLRKSWGLTLVGGLAMTVAITLAASVFDFLTGIAGTSIPLEEGDRVVVIQPWDQASGQEHSSSLVDFARWRDQPGSVVDVGAFRTMQRNLVTPTGPAGPVAVAEMTASGFRLARVSPILGRFFTTEDEPAEAPPVLVIDYDAWQTRFLGSSEVIGQRVLLAGVEHTIIGVMPKDFGFPLNHSYWTPLRTAPSVYTLDTLPEVVVFARLAPDVNLEQADAEIAASGLLDPDAVTATGEPFRPRVVPYVSGIYGGEDLWMIRLIRILVVLILIPPCINISILIYARTVSRQGEFATRSALGASRSRIVSQVFLEVLALSTVSAGVALILARKLVSILRGPFIEQTFGGLPFWMDFSLSLQTILCVLGLAVAAAAISGAIPALRATGRWNQAGLHALRAGSAPRLGHLWTGIVVLQVALTVAALPAAIEFGWWTMRSVVLGPGFAADQFLTARLAFGADAPRAQQPQTSASRDRDRIPDSLAGRFTQIREELIRQVTAEPGIASAAISSVLPADRVTFRVEVDAGANSSDQDTRRDLWVQFDRVDVSFFETLGQSVLIGRSFDATDLEPTRQTIVVNRAFADFVLGDENPLGQRVRAVRPVRESEEHLNVAPEPWLEIIGVVSNLANNQTQGPALYRPMMPGVSPDLAPFSASTATAPHENASTIPPVLLTMRVGPDANSGQIQRKLQEITTGIDPALRADQFLTLQDVHDSETLGDALGGSAIVIMMLGILLVSVAGVYTLVSFTVTQRRREIGIRAALGAQPTRLVAGIFRRVLIPVGVGAVLGGGVAIFLNYFLSAIFIANIGRRPLPWILPSAEGLILLIGLLVLAWPARRMLRIDPVEVLRND